jgi:hypothetical protein
MIAWDYFLVNTQYFMVYIRTVKLAVHVRLEAGLNLGELRFAPKYR